MTRGLPPVVVAKVIPGESDDGREKNLLAVVLGALWGPDDIPEPIAAIRPSEAVMLLEGIATALLEIHVQDRQVVTDAVRARALEAAACGCEKCAVVRRYCEAVLGLLAPARGKHPVVPPVEKRVCAEHGVMVVDGKECPICEVGG